MKSNVARSVVNSRFVLPQLVRLADKLDQVKETKHAIAVDSIIKSITSREVSAERYCNRCYALEEGINVLRSYLTSPKFHKDTTVQVQDVLSRLEEIEANASRMADSVSRFGDDEPTTAKLNRRASNKCTSCGEETEFKLCDECNSKANPDED